jgi:beta-phosphoglucomutase-like phosphatase (HAD superfamily)
MYNIPKSKVFGNKIKGIIFGDHGTLIDPGAKVPILSIMNVFADNRVGIFLDQSHIFYGMTNRKYISSLFSTPEICKKWRMEKNVYPSRKDVKNFEEQLLIEQKIMIRIHGKPIPYVLNMCNELVRQNIKIGISSMLPTEVVEYALKLNPELNNLVDCYVGSDSKSVTPGLEKLMENMEIEYPHEIIKVDSHTEGLIEGKKAGCWVVGVPKYGYYMGLSDTETIELKAGDSQQYYDKKLRDFTTSMSDIGSHYIMDDISNIMDVVSHIENIHLVKLKK